MTSGLTGGRPGRRRWSGRAAEKNRNKINTEPPRLRKRALKHEGGRGGLYDRRKTHSGRRAFRGVQAKTDARRDLHKRG